MTEKRKVSIICEDDFGRVQTAIKTELSAPQIMDKILEDFEFEDKHTKCDYFYNLLNNLHEENKQLKGLVAHYKLTLMYLEDEAKRISKIR